MRPYPKATFTNRKRVFNHRLNVGCKSVECAFGMLTSKFQVFETPIHCSEKTVISIIKCACVLHNYIRKSEGKMYTARNMHAVQNIQNHHVDNINHNIRTATGIREYLCDYFMKPGVSIPSQWEYTVQNDE